MPTRLRFLAARAATGLRSDASGSSGASVREGDAPAARTSTRTRGARRAPAAPAALGDAPGRLRSPDARVIAALAVAFAALTVLTWRRWGNPELDPGADLTAADLVAHGTVPYEQLRYFYGPAGLYALAAAFRVLGTNLTVAFGFGLAQTAAILAAFHALARRWLDPVLAGLATLVLLAIGFSGTLFNFVLPHTNAATFGLLFTLLQALALAYRRPWLAGAAAGVVLLTRPEFVIAAAAIGAGAVLGAWRFEGGRAALRLAVAQLVPALVLGGGVLAVFAAVAGFHRFFFECLIPLDFARVSGGRFQSDWAPFTFESLVGLLARGWAFLGLFAALVVAAPNVRERHGAARIAALWPLAAFAGSLLLLDGASRALGAFPGTRGRVEDDCVRLLLPMSWLPVAAFVAFALGARAFVRRERSPLGGDWPADAALLLGAAAFAIRAYNDFTTDIYATYYAALPLLVAAIGARWVVRRRPKARDTVILAMAVCAFALVVHAWVGLYRKQDAPVRTLRGTYLARQPAAREIQRTVDLVLARSPRDSTLLALPDDPGLYFFTARRPALYEITFLPGTLDSKADELEAIARLERQRTPLVVLGARRFDQYGYPQIGVDYNRVLMAYVRRAYRTIAVFGDVTHPPRNSMPSQAFTVFERRPGA